MNQPTEIGRPFINKGVVGVSAASVAYLLLSYTLVGFKSDQLVLVGLVNGLYYASSQSRKFIIGFSIFVVYWIVFDYMKAFPNYQYNSVHIESLYALEKRLFGIGYGQSILTPNEYWLMHKTTFLNILTGLFYLTWVPIPLSFATYLFFKDRPAFFPFALTFVLVNLLGFVLYYVYPAAPPWYIQAHGFAFEPHTPGNTGGLAAFDQYVGVPVFASIYAKSSNVFAAMPSLHSSYPVIVLYHGIKKRMGSINWFFGLIMVGIWFSAVYTSHHYVLDVLAGITCALTGIALFRQLQKMSWLQSFIRKMVALTA
ncbi:phosphatase PAP2 family protein [Spirosoma radiotolerans]|uniref:PA-phosphatase-like phosphoesterase n=1 Tax=Spirosoma radiotolerans TaxID=1379870 RepID=A0A0E3ZYI6_9BACT|nr:phosphatase PAP2 family protein [Spirosoma radiotolerans]AKD56824.1 PA-phosphatase-like phosphoesterase [Spirosoma radiotolerans]